MKLETLTPESKARNYISRYLLRIDVSDMIIEIKQLFGLEYTEKDIADIAFSIRARRLIRISRKAQRKVLSESK